SILNAESLLDSHPAWEWFQTRYQRIYERLLGQFTALVESGEVRKDVDLPALIQQILAMMDGLQIQWLRFPDQVDLVKSFDAYIAQVDQAIRVRS
ncbi:TetR family transcriptional regulator C-terminal domain-containing protein, partial [Pseudomonas cichorii]|nr:TetR family transcriptional regulator C-terminal domain-containing protein [Pseudomonas cichorii]